MKTILILLSVVMLSAAVSAQSTVVKKAPALQMHPAISSSAAYAEILLRRTELESGLDSLLIDYTEDFPKVLESRQGLLYIERESLRLSRVKPADASKLTLALGRLIVRKIELELDLWNLLRTYKDEHPDVKRAKRKVEIFETAIKEILG